MIKKLIIFVFCLFFFTAYSNSATVSTPYSRGAYNQAINALGKNTFAFHKAGRYCFYNGYRFRLSEEDLLRGEAFEMEGDLFIPETFVGILTMKKIHPQEVPTPLSILKPRWVYDLFIPKVEIPKDVKKLFHDGEWYVSLNDYVKDKSLNIYTDDQGLCIVSKDKIMYSNKNKVVNETVTALFDTPEKYIDPSLSIKYIPWLHEQGEWTKHVDVTPEEIALIRNKPEKKWNVVPMSDYNYEDFNAKLLGSTPPEPGVYPRLLFSPQDIPFIRNWVYSNACNYKSFIQIEELLKRSWLDPNTSDGKIFARLVEGNVAQLRKDMETMGGVSSGAYTYAKLTPDHKPGIYSSHVNYVTNCLTTMSLYALIKGDDELGKRCAAANTTYMLLCEPNVDEHILTSDQEFGKDMATGASSSQQWRGMHVVIPHMDMAFMLDFSGKWMTQEQKKIFERIIAKATYGRRTGGGDGPRRGWRDINHVTWHLTHFISIAAIEGLDGFDPEGYASGLELTRDFLDWGIDKNGMIFESNGKNGGGLTFQILSMIVAARRGVNLWGHPHWRKLMEAQVYVTSPNLERTVTSGTWGGQHISESAISVFKAFYPKDKCADYLLSTCFPNFNPKTFNPEQFRESVQKDKRLRLPGPTYPGGFFLINFPYSADWDVLTLADLSKTLNLNWNTDDHGMFSSFSDFSSKAVWMNMNINSRLYLGAGHHHSDVGMFHFCADSILWFAEAPFQKEYNSIYHNAVLIDGVGSSDKVPAKGDYLGANLDAGGAISTVDLKYNYCWKWCTQTVNWGEEKEAFSGIGLNRGYKDNSWKLEKRPEILDIFRGTENYKMRYWWATPNQSNFLPTVKVSWNPVEYAFRSVGLVRGKHSYGFVVDDFKKDNQNHLYQWTGNFGEGVWKSTMKSPYENSVILAHDKDFKGNTIAGKMEVDDNIAPINGDSKSAKLLVYQVNVNKPAVSFNVEKSVGPVDSKGIAPRYCRMTIDEKSNKANFFVLMIPLEQDTEIPQIIETETKVKIVWKDQVDEISYYQGQDHRTRIEVVRNNELMTLSR